MYSAAISNLFIMQKQKEAFWEQKKGFFSSAVMSLAFARDSMYCDVSHKIKYSFKKMKGAKFQGWQEGGGETKKVNEYE